MSERIGVTLDHGKGEEYDQEMHIVRDVCGFRTGEDLMITTKEGGTASGQPIAMLSFDAQIEDGPIVRAGYVTTVKLLVAIGKALEHRYPEVRVDDIGLDVEGIQIDCNTPPPDDEVNPSRN